MRSKEEYRKIGSIETRAIEECSELIHILCKIDRFGIDNFNPYKPEKDNKSDLKMEIEDVEYIIKELREKYNL